MIIKRYLRKLLVGDRVPRWDLSPVTATFHWFWPAAVFLVWATFTPGINRIIFAVLGIACLGLGVRILSRWRGDTYAARRELLQAARHLSTREIYLNRDEHRMFLVSARGVPGLRFVSIDEYDEEDIYDYIDEGRGQVVIHKYSAYLDRPGVYEKMSAASLEADPAVGEPKITYMRRDRNMFRQIRRTSKSLKRSSMAWMPPDDIRALAGSLQATERIGSRDG